MPKLPLPHLPERPHRARAADVAAIAGVSESAVSRTFRDGSVSAHVRQRVLAAARELGYRPNAMARAVITRRSNVIAILMTTDTNSHFPEVLSELSNAADERGMRVMLFTLDNPANVSAVVDQILSYQVDGVLSLTELPEADARVLETNGVVLVLYNRASATYPANLVSCDHRFAGQVLGRHLLGLDHRRFAIVGGPAMSILAADRAQGVFDALAEAGVARKEVAVATGDFGYESGRAATRMLLERSAGFTALVCINDMMAIGAIDEASGRRVRVPEDLSVASFDGAPAGTWDRYRLTTMRQPLPQLAAAAIEAITQRLSGTGLALEKRLLVCELTPGGSAVALTGEEEAISPEDATL